MDSFPKAPIKEAVLDIRVKLPPETDLNRLSTYHDSIREQYPQRRDEEIYRTKSGADLIAKLNFTNPWLLCSLIHKFGGKEDGEEIGDIPGMSRK